MAVRSRRLFGPVVAPALGIGTPVFTCPADRTALVKWVTFFNQGPVAADISLRLGGIDLDDVMHTELQIPALVTRQLPVFWVLAEGESLFTGTLQVVVVSGHGALLFGDWS